MLGSQTTPLRTQRQSDIDPYYISNCLMWERESIKQKARQQSRLKEPLKMYLLPPVGEILEVNEKLKDDPTLIGAHALE